jgi:hypothetical protein
MIVWQTSTLGEATQRFYRRKGKDKWSGLTVRRSGVALFQFFSELIFIYSYIHKLCVLSVTGLFLTPPPPLYHSALSGPVASESLIGLSDYPENHRKYSSPHPSTLGHQLREFKAILVLFK